MEDLFLKEEVRAGYKVTRHRKQLWMSEIKMLIWLEKICKENDLNYFLIGGSELGVVRHNGFIPWDDDIDIGMLRNDFDKFIQISKSVSEPNYEIQFGLDWKNRIYDRICRIRDNSSTGIIYDQIGANRSHGAFIEIYPYDYVPNDPRKRKKHAKKVIKYQTILSHKLSKNNSWKWKIRLLFHVFEKPTCLIKKLEKLYRQYDVSNYVSSVTLPQYYLSESEVLPIKYISKSRYEKFEFIFTRIPCKAEKCLSIEYGDYMTLPPIEERGKHHNLLVFYDPENSYKKYVTSKSIKELFDRYGFILDI